MNPSEIISIVALLFSVAAGGFAWTTENRLRQQADKRFEFDAVTAQPVEGKLLVLDDLLHQLSVCCVNEERQKRTNLLSSWQRTQHTTWYFSMDGAIKSKDPNDMGNIESRLSRYWDDMSQHINVLSTDLDFDELTRETSAAVRTGQRYISDARHEVQRLRGAF